jgi:N-methylhydantoinase A
LITDGFRAVYEARGWARPDATDLIDPFYRKPPLLAPQSLTHGIPGRMDYQGAELEALDEDAVRTAAQALKADGVESVAVCYLFSFQNAAHENTARRKSWPRHRMTGACRCPRSYCRLFANIRVSRRR